MYKEWTWFLVYFLGVQISFINSSIASGALSGDIKPSNFFDLDTLNVPEWLQNIPLESKVSKYRKRRFYSTSSTLKVTPELTFPSSDFKGTSFSSTAKSALTFTIPHAWQASAKTMSGMMDMMNRTHFFTEVENLIEGMGLHGRSCLLRTICELSDLPFDFGLIGEVINFLFSITTSPNEIGTNFLDQEEDYRRAKQIGRSSGDCGRPYQRCPISVLDMISKIQSI